MAGPARGVDVETHSPDSLAAVWQAASGAALDDRLLEWPPDVFALTEVLLEHSEAYRFAVSPPSGGRWPPATPDWAGDVAAAGAAWAARADTADDALPALVADAWAVVCAAAGSPLAAVADGLAWPVASALLTLHAVADEACAGMGVAVEGLGPGGSARRGRARELLARTGSLARVGPGVRVLPKVRTPDGGISLRSLSRYACVRGPGVGVDWHKIPAQRGADDPLRQVANIVLLPWPLRVRANDFRPQDAPVVRTEREPFAFFDFAPTEPVDLDLIDGLLDAALDEVDVVDMVILPESAVPVDLIADVEGVFERRGVSAWVTGVRDAGPEPGRHPANWVHIGVRFGGRWWHYRQNKHHRWSLDESQILQYHLGSALHPSVRWWEAMEVPRRSVQFVEIGGGITLAAVICEDLARLDAVADLLRTVGPTLVMTVLLDGPQLASRWTARYASVLADDPGSAVLTLTAFGMVERSRPAGLAPSRIVALWKDPARGIREIPLEPGAQGIILSTSVERAARHSADGRYPSDNVTHLRDVGVHQLRIAGDSAREPAATERDTGPALDERELTILSGWSEALVEAGDDRAEVDAVVACQAPDAQWRQRLGLPVPSAGLGAALDALVTVATDGDSGSIDPPLVTLAQQLMRSAVEACRRPDAR